MVGVRLHPATSILADLGIPPSRRRHCRQAWPHIAGALSPKLGAIGRAKRLLVILDHDKTEKAVREGEPSSLHRPSGAHSIAGTSDDQNRVPRPCRGKFGSSRSSVLGA